MLAIIRRIDLDCDAKLNYLEFCDAIRPLEDHVSVLKRTINREKENFIQQRQMIANTPDSLRTENMYRGQSAYSNKSFD